MVYAQVSKTCGRKAVRAQIRYKWNLRGAGTTGAEPGHEEISVEIY